MNLPLPIDPLIPEIKTKLALASALVLEAPPGTGKTTRVPPALLDQPGEIIVLEPRRLAARLAARRVAAEMGERLGETVGYQVRFDEISSAHTRLRFVTEGILTRRLLSDANLKSVSIVILDEFHERHLQGDKALAMLRRLQLTTRPDLKLIVMSATLDSEPIRAFLGDCPVLQAQGRQYEVAIEYAPRADDRPLEQQVAGAVKELLKTGLDGDVLVFLPGAAEIRRAREACTALNTDLLILPLHGDLPVAEQERAILPAAQRKVILATNVAESSITIDGVTAVIDSGLARIASHSPWSGLPTLKIARISRASAIQRAGRAGRTSPGRCLRLYTQQDFDSRPAQETAEIHRVDLSETLLELHAMNIDNIEEFRWLEAPAQSALQTAAELLEQLGALADNRLTSLGRRLLNFSIHPRQARIILEAEARGIARIGCLLAALIGERDIRSNQRGAGLLDNNRNQQSLGPSDLLLLVDAFQMAEQLNFSPERLRAHGLDAIAAQAVDRARKQLLKQWRLDSIQSVQTKNIDQEMLISILAGYPDRVARLRLAANGRYELLLAGGGTAQLAETSVVRKAEFVVAIDVEERENISKLSGRSTATLVRLASQIEADWLLELFIDRISDTTELIWNEQSQRVDLVKRLTYQQLVLEESRAPATNHAQANQLLIKAALDRGWRSFIRAEELERFLARINFLAGEYPQAGWPNLTEDQFIETMTELATGKSSFAELREVGSGLVAALQQQLTSEQRKLLQQMAPERVGLPGGRQVLINYQPDKPPWLASRLQDFFGMANGPKIAGGRVAVVLHLLAPNQRPVQVTTDLAGFWARAYQQVRKELSRRYPRHDWPEDPLQAKPPTVKPRAK